MDQEIAEIFAEYEDDGIAEVLYNINSNDPNMHIVNSSLKDSECSRISSLSEVFLEWYLFDSNTKKNIKTFLANEELSDIFTEKQFMDLLCGDAYLDNRLVTFVALKLPFPLSLGRLSYLNSHVKHGYSIKSNFYTITDKIQELIAQHEQQAKEKEKEFNRQYRETHHEQILENDRTRYKKRRPQVIAQKKIYYQKNKEQIAEKGKTYRETHKEEIKQRKKQYEIAHKEEIAEKRKKYRASHKAEISEKNKKWAQEHPEYNKLRAQKPQRKEYMKAYHKKYAEQNREAVSKQKKAWYEANKERLAEQEKARLQELKQKAETAQKICAAYVFLLKLRKSDYKQYLELYTRQQKPLIGMLKMCPALQSMDINMCPLCNYDCGNDVGECCNQKVLSLPNALTELQVIASELKQR